MALLCALLTGFFLWLLMFRWQRSWRARVREDAGPLLLQVKPAPGIVRACRWATWFYKGFVLCLVAAFIAMFYYANTRISPFFPALLSMFSYYFFSYLVIGMWAAILLLTFTAPGYRGGMEVRGHGILVANLRLRPWSEISECRWFSTKPLLGTTLCTSRLFVRSRIMLFETRMAAGQKEAITAALARFVPVYDHYGTLLAEPTPADLAAKAAQPAHVRRRYAFQFDLQSLLLLAVVVSCAASCYGVHCRRLRPQLRAVEQLEAFSPSVYLFGSIPYSLDYSKCAKKPTDDDLACLEALNQLNDVDLSGSPITDAGIEHLKGLPYLRHINCLGTEVTAQGAEELSRRFPNATVIYGPAKNPVLLKPADTK
jgi:hypothetical protein